MSQPTQAQQTRRSFARRQWGSPHLEERQLFEELEDALDNARKLSRERALGAALRSGADNPQVVMEENTDGLDTYRIRARAMGNPRLTPMDRTL